MHGIGCKEWNTLNLEEFELGVISVPLEFIPLEWTRVVKRNKTTAKLNRLENEPCEPSATGVSILDVRH